LKDSREVDAVTLARCGYIVYCLYVCVCLFVRLFSAEDKASGVKFCTAIHRRPSQGISHFCALCSPRIAK